jgi:hypothetical protein
VKYTSPNQYAGMLERRAEELDGIADRLRADKLPKAADLYEAAHKLRAVATTLREVRRG